MQCPKASLSHAQLRDALYTWKAKHNDKNRAKMLIRDILQQMQTATSCKIDWCERRYPWVLQPPCEGGKLPLIMKKWYSFHEEVLDGFRVEKSVLMLDAAYDGRDVLRQWGYAVDDALDARRHIVLLKGLSALRVCADLKKIVMGYAL